MAYLIVLMLFCCVLGYAAAANHLAAWSILIYSVAAVFCLQLSYAVTALFKFWGGAA